MAGAGQPVYGQYDQAAGGYTAIGGPQLQSYQVIGTVTAGPPIITDPKTGKPYPPNYIPDEQAPGTHEMWTPGSSFAEAKKLQVARIQEFTRAAIESAVRPWEEAAVKIGEGAVDDYGKAVTKLGSEFGKDPGKAASNILGAGGSQALKAGQQIAGQAISSGQKLASQAVKTGQQLLGGSTSSVSGSQTPRMGGMDSALISKAPESSPIRGTSAPSFSQPTSSYLPRSARRN